MSQESGPAESIPGAATPSSKSFRSLRDISLLQWKSGIAAWLGWFFDGLDMHLYGLVAAPFVAKLLFGEGLISADNPLDTLVKEKSSIIQAAFLVGWALGGGFFGRIGDLIGRSRALSLTILTYACFTGLSFFAHTWWQLLIFRFLAALGIGGEWAIGAALLSETWPKHWRPWIAAVLQTGVNLGILVACAVTYLMAGLHPKFVFLVGVIPAFIVFWIRRNVPEPEEWHTAKRNSVGRAPGIADLFRGKVLRTTLLTIVISASSLTAWWAFMFWQAQFIPTLEIVRDWSASEKRKLVSATFFLLIGVSVAGNFFAATLARWLGFRRAVSLMCFGFFCAVMGAFYKTRGYQELVYLWFPLVGFFSGVFSLFTMFLPPLFPTLLRTTGAGFCFNIGRIAAALGVVFAAHPLLASDLRQTLFSVGFLLLPAMSVALLLPEPAGQSPPTTA